MTETVEITFKTPEELVEAARVISEAFSMSLDEYITDALYNYVESGADNNFIEDTEKLRKGMVDRVKVILGKRA